VTNDLCFLVPFLLDADVHACHDIAINPIHHMKSIMISAQSVTCFLAPYDVQHVLQERLQGTCCSSGLASGRISPWSS
jgi:hypothetical protein